MPWVILDTKPTWNVTDLELLKRITYALLENGDADANGTTFLTSQFSIAETIDNMNLIQERLLKDCAPVLLRATQGSVPGQTRYILPADWIYTRRITWQAQASGKAKALIPVDSYSLDRGTPDWEQNTGTPRYYNDGSNLPTLEIEIAKAPSQAGTLGLQYVPQPPTLTGLGVNLMVPDELESAALYGTIGELLSSEGEGCDPERAKYCEQRYSLCVEMANALILGSPDSAEAPNG